MKRDVITFDDDKCNGCGQCVPNCPEGAIQIIEGKAHLVSDLFCDGLGACIGHCPQGAITIENREAAPYDERKVMVNIVKAGMPVVAAHLKHLKDHNQTKYYEQALAYLQENSIKVPDLSEEKPTPCACPGSMARDLRGKITETAPAVPAGIASQLSQWPIQLALVSPESSFFKDADLLIAADCVPFAYPDFHRKFLAGKMLVNFCPKLDENMDRYLEKLTQMFKNNNIRSITMVHMEVPCCFGTVRLVEEALKRSGKNIILKEYTISVSGDII